MSLLAVAGALLVAVGATPPGPLQTKEGQSWSVVGGRLAGNGGNVVELRAGWPGVSVGYARGVGPAELGGRLGFTYATEGITARLGPGGKAQLAGRLRLVDGDVLSLALAFEPGLTFTADRFGLTSWGVGLPLALRAGIAASSAFGVGLSFEVPIWVSLSTRAVTLPLTAGVGVEYFLSSTLCAFALARMGPALRLEIGTAEFALEAVVGVALRP